MSAVDDYLSKVTEPEKSELERVRAIILKAVPDAEQTISYGMPAFKYKGKYLIAYAPFKKHLSVFPGSGAIEACKKKLNEYTISKGTVQFTLDKPLSEALLQALVSARCREIDDK